MSAQGPMSAIAMLRQLTCGVWHGLQSPSLMHSVRLLTPVFVMLSVVSLAGRAHADEDAIELQFQSARCLCGIVTYQNGDRVRGAKVEELGQDWKGIPLRSTESDSEERFTPPPVKGRKIYHLQVRQPGLHLLLVPIRLSRFRGNETATAAVASGLKLSCARTVYVTRAVTLN